MDVRIVTRVRRTAETEVEVRLNLDGQGQAEIATGIGMYDHLLTALARHGGLDLSLRCSGDLEVDDHHSVEDCALTLGQALDEALGERRGIQRFGQALVPMDEALARVAIDLSGRPAACIDLGLRRERLGALATENITHALQSLASAGRFALHVDVLRGANDHHRAEAAFKAVALALRQAVARSGSARIPSTKESL